MCYLQEYFTIKLEQDFFSIVFKIILTAPETAFQGLELLFNHFTVIIHYVNLGSQGKCIN